MPSSRSSNVAVVITIDSDSEGSEVAPSSGTHNSRSGPRKRYVPYIDLVFDSESEELRVELRGSPPRQRRDHRSNINKQTDSQQRPPSSSRPQDQLRTLSPTADFDVSLAIKQDSPSDDSDDSLEDYIKAEHFDIPLGALSRFSHRSSSCQGSVIPSSPPRARKRLRIADSDDDDDQGSSFGDVKPFASGSGHSRRPRVFQPLAVPSSSSEDEFTPSSQQPRRTNQSADPPRTRSRSRGLSEPVASNLDPPPIASLLSQQPLRHSLTRPRSGAGARILPIVEETPGEESPGDDDRSWMRSSRSSSASRVPAVQVDQYDLESFPTEAPDVSTDSSMVFSQGVDTLRVQPREPQPASDSSFASMQTAAEGMATDGSQYQPFEDATDEPTLTTERVPQQAVDVPETRSDATREQTEAEAETESSGAPQEAAKQPATEEQRATDKEESSVSLQPPASGSEAEGSTLSQQEIDELVDEQVMHEDETIASVPQPAAEKDLDAGGVSQQAAVEAGEDEIDREGEVQAADGTGTADVPQAATEAVEDQGSDAQNQAQVQEAAPDRGKEDIESTEIAEPSAGDTNEHEATEDEDIAAQEPAVPEDAAERTVKGLAEPSLVDRGADEGENQLEDAQSQSQAEPAVAVDSTDTNTEEASLPLADDAMDTDALRQASNADAAATEASPPMDETADNAMETEEPAQQASSADAAAEPSLPTGETAEDTTETGRAQEPANADDDVQSAMPPDESMEGVMETEDTPPQRANADSAELSLPAEELGEDRAETDKAPQPASDVDAVELLPDAAPEAAAEEPLDKDAVEDQTCAQAQAQETTADSSEDVAEPTAEASIAQLTSEDEERATTAEQTQASEVEAVEADEASSSSKELVVESQHERMQDISNPQATMAADQEPPTVQVPVPSQQAGHAVVETLQSQQQPPRPSPDSAELPAESIAATAHGPMPNEEAAAAAPQPSLVATSQSRAPAQVQPGETLVPASAPGIVTEAEPASKSAPASALASAPATASTSSHVLAQNLQGKSASLSPSAATSTDDEWDEARLRAYVRTLQAGTPFELLLVQFLRDRLANMSADSPLRAGVAAVAALHDPSALDLSTTVKRLFPRRFVREMKRFSDLLDEADSTRAAAAAPRKEEVIEIQDDPSLLQSVMAALGTVPTPAMVERMTAPAPAPVPARVYTPNFLARTAELFRPAGNAHFDMSMIPRPAQLEQFSLHELMAVTAAMPGVQGAMRVLDSYAPYPRTLALVERLLPQAGTAQFNQQHLTPEVQDVVRGLTDRVDDADLEARVIRLADTARANPVLMPMVCMTLNYARSEIHKI